MSEKIFSEIWYASDEYYNKLGPVKAGQAFEDQGFLAVSGAGLEFRGLDGIVPLPNVQSVELIQKKLRGGTRAMMILLASVFLFCGVCGGIGFAAVLVEEGGNVAGFVVGLVLLGLLTVGLAGVLVWLAWKATPWIKVVYGGGQEAYLADGRFFGWRGIAGGTKQLGQQLQSHLTG